MQIGNWPIRRVIWLSVAWFALVSAAVTVRVVTGLRALPPDDSGMAGFGVDLSALTPLLPLLLIPPACLILLWIWQRKKVG